MVAVVEQVDQAPEGNRGDNILLIDDLRHFRPEILDGLPADSYIRICRTVESAMEVLHYDQRQWDQVWLDHDLGKDEDGETVEVIPVIDYIERRVRFGHAIPVANYIIHTSNGVGAGNIARALSSIGLNSVIVNAKDFLFVPEGTDAPSE